MIAAVLVMRSAMPACAADPDEEKVEKLLSKMSTNEKIAQMMVVAMPAKDAAAIQKKYQFGGYILFAGNFYRTDKKGMKKLLKSCQSKSKIPMLLGTDEEGGMVVRASLYRKYRRSKFRSPRTVYNSGGWDGITKDTRSKDKFMKSLGLNCNFAPVADIPYSRSNFIYERAISTSKGRVTKFVKLTVTQMNKDDVISTLKHFPGYGNNGDTHGRIIRDRRSKKVFTGRDLKPFKAGIAAGADMIMVSHTIVDAFDSKRPASLSKKVHKYLRKELKYDGVVITDGLGMKGITDFVGGDPGKAAVRAVQAGNDMLCVTANYSKCYRALKAAVRDGRITEDRLDESVRRILRMKIRRGI